MTLIVEKDVLEVFSFITGAFIGSLLNLFIEKLPKNEKIDFSSFNMLPIFSFFIKKENLQNSIIELITALLTFFIFIRLGFSQELILVAVFFYTLIALSFIDFKYKAVPDYLLLIVLILSFFITQEHIIDAFKYAFIVSGAFVLLNFMITFYIQNIKSRILKDENLKSQEALGEGDIPVLASFGVILGLKGTLIAVFLSSIFAIIPSIYFMIKKKSTQIPFIPYLSLGFTVEYFFNISKVFS